MPTEQALTILAAIYGAVASTVALGWNVYRDVTDRGRLRVSCSIGNIVFANGMQSPRRIIWHVTNCGRQPSLVTTIGGTFRDGKHGVMFPSGEWPVTLKPGEYLIQSSDDFSLLRPELVSLWVRDSLDREFRVSKRQVRNLKRSHRGQHHETES